MEIGLHKLLHQIYFCEVCEGWGTEDVQYSDDVLVVEMAEELDLAKGAQAEHGVIEGGDALDSNFPLRRDMNSRACSARARPGGGRHGDIFISVLYERW